MKKRSLALLLVMAMLLTCVLAACGDGGDTSSTASTPDTGSTVSTPTDDTDDDTSEPTETSTGNYAAAGIVTEVGTPREETLIVEVQNPTDCPGQFNCYMTGTSKGFGIQQALLGHLWEMDTASGEQFPELAADMGTPNEDFTEWTITLREGIKWSDGEDFNADDVVFTFNEIMTNSNLSASAGLNLYMESCEKVDDYTVLFKMKESYPRFTQQYGITIYGTTYLIMPEHLYSQQADVSTFKDENPVSVGPYTVEDYDPNGKWVLYTLRDDWFESSTLGIVGADHYGYTKEDAPAKYLWFRVLGDSSTKQMMMVSNEVDVMCEVTMEEYKAMNASNENVKCWYDDFPYANCDDPCSKGIVFSIGKGAPYDNKDFRWGVTLALNIDDISMNIFEGVGRASPIPIMNNSSYLQQTYTIPMQEWLEDFELDLGDGTTFKPYDTGYAARIAEKLGVTGTEDELIEMFGAGWWKHDEEAATKLLNKAGLEKVDGVWCYEGEPFEIEMSYLADTEQQAGRGLQAAYNQLTAFGFKCNLVSKSSATWSTDSSTGNFDIGGYWPTGGILKDFYTTLSGWDNELIVPLGEIGSGQGARWDSQEATDIIKKLANTDPTSDEAYDLHVEFLKVAVEEMPIITFHSGTKFVPTNSTYWEGYPCANDPYNGPWWWWSCFKYMLPKITPVEA